MSKKGIRASKSIENLEKPRFSRKLSLIRYDTREFFNTVSDAELLRPEHQNLAASFSTPNIAQKIKFDNTVYKFLPVLKKKHLPSSFQSVKHAINFANKFKRKSKKLIKPTRLETVPPVFDYFPESSVEPSKDLEPPNEVQEKAKVSLQLVQSLNTYDLVIDPLSPRSLLESKKTDQETAVIGHSKWFFADGTCIWRQCTVEKYDEAAEKFLISWPDGKTKFASRINLRFDDEDPQRFEKRIIAAQQNRKVTQEKILCCMKILNNSSPCPDLPSKVILIILEYVKCANKISLQNYKNPLVYYTLPPGLIHNPGRFLWKKNAKHFEDESLLYKSRGLKNHAEYIEIFANSLQTFELFKYPAKSKKFANVENIRELVFELQENWKMTSKEIDLFSKKHAKQLKKRAASAALIESAEVPADLKIIRIERFLGLLNRANNNVLMNDSYRILIAQQIGNILIAWQELRLLPSYLGKAVSKDKLLKSYESHTSNFIIEAQNAFFDIQFEIQKILTEEDQKRIERNKMKLKARAYNKQVVDLEETLPYDLIKKYKKFVKVCNMRIENGLLRSVFQSLDEFDLAISNPIGKLREKLSEGNLLSLEEIELAVTTGKSLINIQLAVDWNTKSVVLDQNAQIFCQKILHLVATSIENLEKVPCLYTTHTGAARPSSFIAVTKICQKKYQKKLKLIEENIKKQFVLLKAYVSNIEKYNFVFSIKPSDFVKEFEDENGLEKINLQVIKMSNTIEEIENVFGNAIKSIGIWNVNSKIVKSSMVDIIRKANEELFKLVKDDILHKSQVIEEKLVEIQEVIGNSPCDLDELDSIRNYINVHFEGKMEYINSELKNVMGSIQILEFHWFYIPYELYQKVWNCFKVPQALKDLKCNCLDSLKVLMVSFTKDLMQHKDELLKNIEEMVEKLEELKKEDDINKQDKISLFFKQIEYNIESAAKTAKTVNSHEEIIGKKITSFQILEDLKKNFTPYCKLWYFIRDFVEKYPQWMDGPINLLHRDAIAVEVTGWTNELARLERAYFKSEPAALKLCQDFLVKVNSFRPYLPVIRCVNNPGMKERHWIEFSQKSNIDLARMHNMTLSNIINIGIMDYIEQLEAVSDFATKEHGLENAKKKMENEWNQIIFEIISYKSSYILSNTEVLWDILNEHLMRTIAMTSSPYIQFILTEVTTWKGNLLRIQDTLEEWEKFQKNWQYLIPIFMNAEISKQLSHASNKFKNVNSQWENIMTGVKLNPNVYEYCISHTKLQETLNTGNEALDSIFKSLNEYLMTKRRAFPRFYFLSNEELITMLSNSQDVKTIQKYIVKCFEAIAGVIENGKDIVGMISPEGERVQFECTVSLYCGNEIKSIEIWMVDLEKEMRSSLTELLVKALYTYNLERLESWVKSWPSQLIHTSIMALWTSNVENAITTNTMAKLLESEKLLLNSIVDQVRSDPQPLVRSTFSTLVVLDVHNLDIVQNLISEKVADTNNFTWFSNLRYYLNENKMEVKMLDCVREYGYEYLGNTGRLVITELTGRCFMILMSALNMSLGGAPEGPAGTGKTETTKDLAKNIAKKCVVFNCSDRIDHIYMAKFFTGLCYCGAWACFDEFNRIELDVLSVIAEQILTIQTAVQKKADFLHLDGEMVKLDPSCAVFITMNPDYAGRVKLPDNLKALFRPVTMMIPEYGMIAEIYLYSFGFKQARVLSKKIVNSLKLASEQLSTQHHYDYGMRAVSTIIKAAGLLKHENPQENEEILVLKAIRNINIPKFLNQDIPLFNGIIKDLFPEITSNHQYDQQLLDSISEAMIESSLIENKKFVMKVCEIFLTIETRHGLMIVGESMSGKSTAIHILSKALSYSNPVTSFHINPKSMTSSQLYGAPDVNSQDWKDGVLGQAIRMSCDLSSKGYKWIVLDGPVDAMWIESLNTVLDDNKKLCLSSGEIIKLNDTIRMLFEVDDLSYASPATVSRCGMIYMDSEDIIGTKNLVNQWIAFPPMSFTTPRFKKLFDSLYSSIFWPALEYWKKEIQEKKLAASSPIQVTQNMITLFESLILRKMKSRKQHDKEVIEENSMNKVESTLEEQLPKEKSVKLIEIVSKQAIKQEIDKFIKPKVIQDEDEKFCNLFVFSVQWSLGGSCNSEGRKLISDYIYSIAKNLASIPQSFHKYFYDQSENTWTKWKSLLNTPIKTPEITTILVPTIPIVTYKYFLNELITRKVNIIVTGETGTGKTLLIKSFLPEADKSFETYFTMFSARTATSEVQTFLEANIVKRRKGYFGPNIGKYTIFSIDDLSMPSKEQYGCQPVIEFLRSIVDKGEMFDRDSLELKILEDVQFIGAMGSLVDGRSTVSNRFLSHFFLMNFSSHNTKSIFLILTTLLNLGFSNHLPEILQRVNNLSNGIISVFIGVLNSLPPTPSKSHYTFNLRDLASVLKGLFMVSPHKLDSTETLYKLLVHECLRVFSDRLIDETDKETLINVIKNSLFENFQVNWDTLITTLPVFCNYIADKTYQESLNPKTLKKSLKMLMEDYNGDTENKLNLIFFNYAVEHINRISRVLAWANGNLLLIGISGSGRMSLTKLCAHIKSIQVFQIKLTRAYGLEEWREDLKSVLITAGQENKPIVFLLRDNEIAQEEFLGDINNILNTGQSPNLFATDEIQGINESLKMNKKYVPLTDQQRWEIFVGSIQRNLHIVLCMSPLGEVMRRRLRQFPSLANCCTIDWFTDWPIQALSAVAKHYLKREIMQNTPEKLENAINLCVYFHETVKELSVEYLKEFKRYNYVTPSHYLLLLQNVKMLYYLKEVTTIKQTNKYAIGVKQLDSTQAHVQKLRAELMALKPILQQKTILAEETLSQIQKENADADITRSIVASEQKSSQEQAMISESIKQECQAALAIALPELESAIKALDTIRQNDIDLVKTMHNPPEAVRLTLEALAIVNKLKPVRVKGSDSQSAVTYDYFESGKKMLSIPKFIRKLKQFDRESLEEDTINKIAPYMDLEKFKPEIVNYASSAAKGLCKWVRAMFNFYHVNKEIKPKKDSLKIAEEDLREKIRVLKIKQEELKKVEDYVEELQNKLELQMAETKALSDEIHKVELQMDRAVKLIEQLGGERASWTVKVKQLSTDLVNLLGDVLMSAGVITYMGPFIWSYREICVQQKWIPYLGSNDISCSDKFNVAGVIGQRVKIQKWNLLGLPSDKVSIENAVIIKHSSNYPLIIDPQGQAFKWLKKKLTKSKKQLVRTKNSSPDFMSVLENSLLLGANLMVENIQESIDPVLDPLLLKQFHQKGSEKTVVLRDAVCNLDPNFYLYLFCSHSNPHFSAEVYTKVTVLNFSITEEALGEQMLDLVCRKEMPKETEERNKLTVQSVEYLRNVQALEDKILELLKSGGPNILESEELINSLTDSKIMAIEVEKKLANAKMAEQRIVYFQGNYSPAAKLSAILYFCIADLANIEVMYQYSMSWFLVIFKKALSVADKSKDLNDRVKSIVHRFRELIYQGIYNSLQDKDRTLFVFLVAIRLMLYDKEVQAWQWRFFLTGICGVIELEPNPTDFLSDKLWRDVTQLDIHITGLCDHLKINGEVWKKFINTDKQWSNLPTLEEFSQYLPEPYNNTTLIARMLILRAIKPEALGVAVKSFVKSSLGEVYLKSHIFSLPSIFSETSSLKPLIFILGSGNDPQSSIKRYTNEIGVTLKTGSLGRGQCDKAEKLIKESAVNGSWVLLQNCHLAITWLSTLENIMEGFSLEKEKVNDHFRLILTAMPTPGFPSGLLQKSVKVIAQSPGGLCNSLLGIYSGITESKAETLFYQSSDKPSQWKALFFCLSFFHCIIRERRNFGPVGWNIAYEFNESDLHVSSRQLMKMIEKFETPSFEALIHVTANCNYGGRVTDAWDFRTLTEMLLSLYNPEILNGPKGKIIVADGYSISFESSIENITNEIKRFPQVQSPEIFGLHPNAELSKNRTEAYGLCSRLLALQPRAISISYEEQKNNILSLCDMIISKILNRFDVNSVNAKYDLTYFNSMNTVLIQELGRYNKLTDLVKSSLIYLKKTYEGIMPITPEYEVLGESLLENKVPSLWSKNSYSSCKSLASWVEDLYKRLSFFQHWIDFGRPKVFWISGFYFTQSFLTATLQEYARKNKFPIDTLSFSFEVLDCEPEESPENGALIKGLYLEGASWDGSALAECKPRELYCEFPIVRDI